MFNIDAHLDLSMNALEWNRDLRQPVSAINEREYGMNDKPDRAKAVVSLPELRKGNIGLVVATQIGRYVAPGNTLPGWHSPHQAWAQTQGQLAWYKAMEEAGEMVQVNNLQGLEKHIKLWESNGVGNDKPVGYILSLEGADSIITLNHLERAYNDGLRALGPAHYGPGRYANGTDATGLMGAKGIELLKPRSPLHTLFTSQRTCGSALRNDAYRIGPSDPVTALRVFRKFNPTLSWRDFVVEELPVNELRQQDIDQRPAIQSKFNHGISVY